MSNPRRPLRLNVGLLVTAAIGTSRDFTFEYDSMRLGEDLLTADFNGTARFSRTPQGLFLQGEFKASLALDCVRCLEGYQHQVSWELTEMYAFDSRSLTESNLLVPEDGQIDLSSLMREYVLLEIPIQPVCSPGCKGLCPECGENRNHVDCGHSGNTNESPFSVLKDLLQ